VDSIKKIRILYLPKYGEAGPSSRYRFYQYKPLLEAEGFVVRVKPLLNDSYVQELYRSGRKKHYYLLMGCLRRISGFLFWHRYDLIVVEYELLPYFPAWGEFFIRALGGKYIVDLDDAVYIRYSQNSKALWRFLYSKKTEQVIKYSTDVIVGNTFLQNYVSEMQRESRVIPTVVSISRYPNYDNKSMYPPFRIVWIGSPQTSAYLVQLIEVFKDLRDRISLKIIGAESKIRDLFKGINVEWVDWNNETEISEIQGCHIGIMPLTDDDWARGKSGFKLIQYMACKLPVVASPVGANKEIVSDGVTGYLATSTGEWKEALNKLINNPVHAKKLGEEGYKKFVNEYSLESVFPRYLEIIKGNLKK
jgi:glycosyltransferase involved in cell wall biosynthesis